LPIIATFFHAVQQIPQMTAEKANLAKKIPLSPKKGTFLLSKN
jgi:hypothetical protein